VWLDRCSIPICAPRGCFHSFGSQPAFWAPSEHGAKWIRLAEELLNAERLSYLSVLMGVTPAHELQLHVGWRPLASRDTTCPPIGPVMPWANDWVSKQPRWDFSDMTA